MSNLIATEGKRDSSSMKTIAAVTMVFLPGTFVAVRIHLRLLFILFTSQPYTTPTVERRECI
jgi:hypothetical protein